jgi:hypothetical protein
MIAVPSGGGASVRTGGGEANNTCCCSSPSVSQQDVSVGYHVEARRDSTSLSSASNFRKSKLHLEIRRPLPLVLLIRGTRR